MDRKAKGRSASASEQTQLMATTRRYLRPISLLGGLCLLAVIGWQYSIVDLLVSGEWTTRELPVVLLALGVAYLVRPFFLWPLSVFSVFIGYVFGFPAGLPVVLAGTVLTCLPPFLIAARYGTKFPYVDWLAGRGQVVVEATGEFRGMIAARLSPAPADAVSYGAGLAGVSTRAFVAGTLIGELPWALFYVLLGRSLRTFSAGAVGVVDLRLLLVTAVLSVALVAPKVYDLVRQRRREKGTS